MNNNLATKLMNLIDSITHAAAVTALVVGSSFAFACFMAWLFGVL